MFLMAEGKSETEEADRVRDLMDDHWYRMSPEEIRRVRGLIRRPLHARGSPASTPSRSTNGISPKRHRLVEAARNNQDWDNLLELLRERPHPYPPDRVAFMRAELLGKTRRPGDVAALSAEGGIAQPIERLLHDRPYVYLAASWQAGGSHFARGSHPRRLRVARSRLAVQDGQCELIGSISALGDDVRQKERVITKAIESIEKALENEGLLPEGEKTASSAVAGSS